MDKLIQTLVQVPLLKKTAIKIQWMIILNLFQRHGHNLKNP